jgi:hypothetical protein
MKFLISEKLSKKLLTSSVFPYNHGAQK